MIFTISVCFVLICFVSSSKEIVFIAYVEKRQLSLVSCLTFYVSTNLYIHVLLFRLRTI